MNLMLMRQRKKRVKPGWMVRDILARKGKPPMVIDSLNLELDDSDEFGWRNYELTTHGYSPRQLIENATVTAMDQDGGEIWTVALLDCDSHIQLRGLTKIMVAYESSIQVPA